MNDDDWARLDKVAVRRAFDRAASTYDEHAALHQHVAATLIGALDYINHEPTVMLDLGCGTGLCAKTLLERYPKSHLLMCDISSHMLRSARGRLKRRWRYKNHYVNGDIEALPFTDGAADFVFSNLALQWCNDLDAALEECARVLAPNGLLLFSSLGPDTLLELRRIAEGQPGLSVNQFIDMHDVGDALVRAGFAGPVMECDMMTMTYENFDDLLLDLKGVGATNHRQDRRRGLTPPSSLQRVADEYEALRRNSRLPATYEVIYGHAWRRAEGERKQDGSTVATFPFSQLTRSPRR